MAGRKELERLLQALLQLGQEVPSALISLTQIVSPRLPDEQRVQLLGSMFKEAPAHLESLSEAQVKEALRGAGAGGSAAWRLLLDLRQVQSLLLALDYLALLILAKTLAPSLPAQQLTLLQQLQRQLQGWGHEQLQRAHGVLAQTPLHLERAALLQLEPQFPLTLLPLSVQLLRLSYDQLERFKLWLDALPSSALIVLVNLLQLDQAVLVDLKRRLDERDPAPAPHALKRPRDLAAHLDTLRLSGDHPPPKMARTEPAPSLAQSQGVDPFAPALHHSGHFAPPSLQLSAQLEPDYMAQDTDGFFAPPQEELRWDEGLSLGGDEADPFGQFMNFPLDASHGTLRFTGEFPPPPVDSMDLASPDEDKEEEKPLPLPPASSSPFPPLPPEPKLEYAMPFAAASGWGLRIQKQPPAQTVYQRIIKPFPAITLLAPSVAASAQLNLFVEASVVRADSEKELPLCLDGSRVIRIQAGMLATFRKLKILATTVQQGCLFRLRFQLKRYEGNQFITVPGALCISNPIEVFSHTYYLNNRKKNAPPPPPTITEILPSRGAQGGGSRCVILGSNFIDSPSLRVRFGTQVVKPIFHENKTLICVCPPHEPGAVPVAVSNDGTDFCASSVRFTFE